MSKYPESVEKKKENSTFIQNDTQLRNQLSAEISSNRPNWESTISEFRTTDGVRPRLYYWTSNSEVEEVMQADAKDISGIGSGLSELEKNNVTPKFNEHSLYPALIQFMENERSFNGFRIDEKRSSNKHGSGGNRWLFPDVVGMENLTNGMQSEVISAVRESRSQQICLWSFEVKVLVNRSNVREAYFQAVSNSSWSNYGYLVVNEIASGALEELRILYAMHGIGVIRLDYYEPTESQILIQSRERKDIEWSMASRLAEENRDFENFIRSVRQYYQTGDF